MLLEAKYGFQILKYVYIAQVMHHLSSSGHKIDMHGERMYILLEFRSSQCVAVHERSEMNFTCSCLLWSDETSRVMRKQYGFRTSSTYTALYRHRRLLEAGNFIFRKKRNCTKALISFTVTASFLVPRLILFLLDLLHTVWANFCQACMRICFIK